MRINIYNNMSRETFEYEAVEMKIGEFDKIKGEKDTPTLVSVSDDNGKCRVFYNDCTCSNGYAGTCLCLSHPQKRWREYFPDTMKWGKVVYRK